MHADSGRPVKAYQGWRRSAKGRGRGWGTGNEETAPEKTVLAAVCRLTYVQGANVSYRWTCARENKDTPPQEDQGRKATDKKGWGLFERVAARVCGELRRTSGTIAALRGPIKLNSYEFGLYQVLPRKHITCTKSKHAFTTCSFVTFAFTLVMVCKLRGDFSARRHDRRKFWLSNRWYLCNTRNAYLIPESNIFDVRSLQRNPFLRSRGHRRMIDFRFLRRARKSKFWLKIDDALHSQENVSCTTKKSYLRGFCLATRRYQDTAGIRLRGQDRRRRTTRLADKPFCPRMLADTGA